MGYDIIFKLAGIGLLVFVCRAFVVGISNLNLIGMLICAFVVSIMGGDSSMDH